MLDVYSIRLDGEVRHSVDMLFARGELAAPGGKNGRDIFRAQQKDQSGHEIPRAVDFLGGPKV